MIAVISDPQDLAASGEGWSTTTRAGSKLRVISYVSHLSRLRGIRMSPQRSLGFQIAVFLARSARRSSREVRLSQDLLYTAEDERNNRFDRLDGCAIRGLPSQLGLQKLLPLHHVSLKRQHGAGVGQTRPIPEQCPEKDLLEVNSNYS